MSLHRHVSAAFEVTQPQLPLLVLKTPLDVPAAESYLEQLFQWNSRRRTPRILILKNVQEPISNNRTQSKRPPQGILGRTNTLWALNIRT